MDFLPYFIPPPLKKVWPFSSPLSTLPVVLYGILNPTGAICIYAKIYEHYYVEKGGLHHTGLSACIISPPQKKSLVKICLKNLNVYWSRQTNARLFLKVLRVYPQLKVIDDRGGTFCKFSILFVSCTARTINPKLKLGTLYTGI